MMEEKRKTNDETAPHTTAIPQPTTQHNKTTHTTLKHTPQHARVDSGQ